MPRTSFKRLGTRTTRHVQMLRFWSSCRGTVASSRLHSSCRTPCSLVLPMLPSWRFENASSGAIVTILDMATCWNESRDPEGRAQVAHQCRVCSGPWIPIRARSERLDTKLGLHMGVWISDRVCSQGQDVQLGDALDVPR